LAWALVEGWDADERGWLDPSAIAGSKAMAQAVVINVFCMAGLPGEWIVKQVV
jgi:hypothetical protein